MLVAVYIFTLVPEFLMRFITWVLVNTLYRVRVEGMQHVPEEGPALLVCNHVSFMDPLLLMANLRRPARFVMYYRIFNTPLLSFVFRTAKAIPIAGYKEDPAVLQQAYEAIDAALAAGELVCIFPEGGLTRDGEIATVPARAWRRFWRAGRCRWCRWRCAGCGAVSGAGAIRCWGARACRAAFGRGWSWWSMRRCRPNRLSASALEARVRELRGDLA